MTPITHEEADRFIAILLRALATLDEAERKPSSAIPRGIMTSGELIEFAAISIALATHVFPELYDDDLPDVVSLYYRAIN